MAALIILIGLIVGLNLIPALIKGDFPKSEKTIIKLLVVSSSFFVITMVLDFLGYRLKGLYSTSIIATVFLFSTVIFFAVFKNTTRKFSISLILIPILFLALLTLMFENGRKEVVVDDKTKIITSASGFFSCGETLQITQSSYGIFDKEVYKDDELCLSGIERVEIVSINDKLIDLFIYHDRVMNSENPYKCFVERNGNW